MNCKKCGSPLIDGDKFCKNCGASVNEENAQTQSFGQEGSQPTNQQQWQNNNNQGYNSISTNNNVKFIVLGIVVVAVIVASIFIIPKLSGGKGEEVVSGGSNTQPSEQVLPTQPSEQVLPTQSAENGSSYKVKFKGFTFNIPDKLIYNISESALTVGDETGTWAAQFEVIEANFIQLKSNKSQLQLVYQKEGYTCSAAIEKTLGGVDFITLELTARGQNGIMGLAKANSMNIIGVVALNQNNEFDYSILETIAPIISSVTYTPSSVNLESSKFSINTIKGLVK